MARTCACPVPEDAELACLIEDWGEELTQAELDAVLALFEEEACRT